METTLKQVIQLGNDYMNYLTNSLLKYDVGLHTLKYPDHVKDWFIADGEISFFKSNFFRIHSIQIDAIEISNEDITLPVNADTNYLKEVYYYGKEFLESLHL